eukprot:NODE_2354_length_1201_cov_61.519553_g2240_i0.p1 GENE.NODE_2354_length_1201_cov_61.519553_g2240_i0~~NODE_2354_length_1201_cov_61.519553_g2240_i0.p1  ORF type:complete len:334 (+),score=111.06 NODE_2354_length_1201_cov_61.519553_g2240_i0:57-1058(+)
MVLEATFLCVDNSEFMRNGDFAPTRMAAVHEACNLVVGAKTQSNPENTVGLLTMGGKSVRLMETLTSNLGRILAALSSINIDGRLHFSEGLQISQLGLKHRQNKQQRQRIIVFVGSPIAETEKQLETLGKKLKKNSVAVDVVTFGVEENVPKLETFINAINSQENSRLINVPFGVTLADVLVSSPIITEDGAPATGNAADFEFGVDPAQDPELAAVLRMSMEDERRRQEAEQQAKSGGDTEMKPAEPTPAPTAELTEEEQIALALKMSMGENLDSPAPSQPELTEAEQMELALKMSMNVDMEPGAEEAMNDESYMAEIAKEMGLDPTKKPDKQ